MSGHVWANRFYSTPLDGEHLGAAVRYVELIPVGAGLGDSGIERLCRDTMTGRPRMRTFIGFHRLLALSPAVFHFRFWLDRAARLGTIHGYEGQSQQTGSSV